ncbi:hypothetical protein IG631_20110 [Alternaria alternata]|nr:hypothetical protein IG631_20110 [Alternaria alternata]
MKGKLPSSRCGRYAGLYLPEPVLHRTLLAPAMLSIKPGTCTSPTNDTSECQASDAKITV